MWCTFTNTFEIFCTYFVSYMLINIWQTQKRKICFLFILASCELQVKFCDLSSPVKVSCGNNWQHYLPCRVAVSFIDHGKCLSYCTTHRHSVNAGYYTMLLWLLICLTFICGVLWKNVKCSLFKTFILDFQVKMGVESSTKFSCPSTSQNRKNEQ